MSWEKNLLDASYKGTVFDCVSIRDSESKAVQTYEFPFVDGGESIDMGARPTQIAVTAIFFGEDYETRLQAFRKLLRERGPGELVHPVFGKHQVQVLDHSIDHTAESPDSATLQFNCLVHTGETRIFTSQSAKQSADGIGSLASNARDSSGLGFLRQVNSLKQSLTLPSDLLAVRDQMGLVNNALATLSPRSLLSGLSILDSPLSFLGDFRSVLGTFLLLPSLESFGLARWRRDSASIGQVNFESIPAPTNTAAAQAQTLVNDLAGREQAIQRAEVAGEIISLEADSPTLTPAEIETIVNDARTDLEVAIVRVRALYPLESHNEISSSLRDLAYQVQEAARQVLEVRPPLIKRTVPDDGNLHLVAHWWYGDYTRAKELLRLNPEVSNPNFIKAGQVLNAFAQ